MRAKTFSGLFDDGKYLQKQAGFTSQDDVDLEMKKYYSEKDIKKYGVIGFVLK